MGYVLEFQTEVFTGYLAPILKSIPAGGGTGSDVWTLYNYATISFIVVGSLMVLIGKVLPQLMHMSLIKRKTCFNFVLDKLNDIGIRSRNDCDIEYSLSCQYQESPSHAPWPSCSKVTMSLVNDSLKFQNGQYYKYTYFLLIKCDNPLQCRGFSHFINKE